MQEQKNQLMNLMGARETLQSLIDSKKLPAHIKSVEDAFTIAQMGKELGFPILQAMHYIIPIQGKLSLSAKAIGAILRRNKVSYQTTEDAVYVYADGTVADYKKEEPKAIDRRTTVVFTRDGVQESVNFTWRDAVAAGLSTKDNWVRMPKEMLFARCLSKGANRIAPDFLLGLYMTDELTDSFNISEDKIKRSEDGTVENVTEDITHTEVK